MVKAVLILPYAFRSCLAIFGGNLMISGSEASNSFLLEFRNWSNYF